jgi:hypothetical protein
VNNNINHENIDGNDFVLIKLAYRLSRTDACGEAWWGKFNVSTHIINTFG